MTDKEIEQLAIIEYPEYDINEMEEYYNIIRRVAFKKGYKAALLSNTGEARPVDERYIREVSERIYNKLQSKGIVNTSVWVINEVLDTYFNIEKPDAIPVKEVDVDESRLFIDSVYGVKKETLRLFFDAGYDYRSSLLPEIIKEFGERSEPSFGTFYDNYKKEMPQLPIKEAEDTPKPFTGEMWCFLLANSLRCLTEEQRAGLCFDLYGRSIIRESIDSRIKELRKPSEEGEDKAAHAIGFAEFLGQGNLAQILCRDGIRRWVLTRSVGNEINKTTEELYAEYIKQQSL